MDGAVLPPNIQQMQQQPPQFIPQAQQLPPGTQLQSNNAALPMAYTMPPQNMYYVQQPLPTQRFQLQQTQQTIPTQPQQVLAYAPAGTILNAGQPGVPVMRPAQFAFQRYAPAAPQLTVAPFSAQVLLQQQQLQQQQQYQQQQQQYHQQQQQAIQQHPAAHAALMRTASNDVPPGGYLQNGSTGGVGTRSPAQSPQQEFALSNMPPPGPYLPPPPPISDPATMIRHFGPGGAPFHGSTAGFVYPPGQPPMPSQFPGVQMVTVPAACMPATMQQQQAAAAAAAQQQYAAAQSQPQQSQVPSHTQHGYEPRPSQLWKPPTSTDPAYYQTATGSKPASAEVASESRGGTMKRKPRANAIAIIDPNSQEQIKLDMSPPSSAATEASNIDESTRHIQNEFASKVARAAASDNAMRASSEQRSLVSATAGKDEGLPAVTRRGSMGAAGLSSMSSSADSGVGGMVPLLTGTEEPTTAEGSGSDVTPSGAGKQSPGDGDVMDSPRPQLSETTVQELSTSLQSSTVTTPAIVATEEMKELKITEQEEAVKRVSSMDETPSVQNTSSEALINGLPDAAEFPATPRTLVAASPAVTVATPVVTAATAVVATTPAVPATTQAAIPASPSVTAASGDDEQRVGSSDVIEDSCSSAVSASVDKPAAGDAPSLTATAADIKPDESRGSVNPATSGGSTSAAAVALAVKRRKYERDFLLQMKTKTECQVKPKDLPDMPEVVLNSPYSSQAPQRPAGFPQHMPQSASFPSFHGYHDMFTPNYIHSPMQMMRPPMGGPMMRGPPPGMMFPGGMRNVASRPDMSSTPRVVIAINKDVELNRADNAWKPAALTKKDSDIDPQAVETEKMFKTVRSILNKITPQTLDVLIDKVMALDISSEARLVGIIRILFEKAISEPHFCPAYAALANKMITIKVPLENKPEETTTFRKLLLNRCQEEFEKDKQDDAEIEKLHKALDEETNEEKKKVLSVELDETLTKSRKRSLGNIKFIAELFKLKMLTENIMHDCMRKLLKNRDEDSLECLGRLLTNIGKDLDVQAGQRKPGMEIYFTELRKLANDKENISARIRFMLQDVIELKQNKWVPRRVDNNPKTIQQIHQEAENEKLEKEQMIKNLPPQVLSKPRPPMGRGGAINDDGWNTVPKSSREKIDASKIMRISKASALDENSLMLGPPRMGSMSNWSSGSRGGSSTATPKSQDYNDTPSGINRYSVLDGRESGGRQMTTPRGKNVPPRLQEEHRSSSLGYGRSSPRLATPTSSSREGSRDSSRTRDPPSSIGSDYGRCTPPQTGETPLSVGNVRYTPGSTDISRDSSLSREATPPLPSGECVRLPDKLENKLHYLLKEYHSEKDVEEACLSLSELKLTGHMLASAISSALNYSIERSLVERQLTGQLMSIWVERKLITADQLIAGIQDLLLVMPDLLVDIPLGWEYLSSIVEPLLTSGVLTLRHLVTCCDTVQLNTRVNNAAGLIVSHLLHYCHSTMQNQEKVKKLWKESGIRWSEIDSAEVKDFFTSRGLEYLLLL